MSEKRTLVLGLALQVLEIGLGWIDRGEEFDADKILKRLLSSNQSVYDRADEIRAQRASDQEVGEEPS